MAFARAARAEPDCCGKCMCGAGDPCCNEARNRAFRARAIPRVSTRTFSRLSGYLPSGAAATAARGGYVSAFEDLGADITIAGTADNLVIAKLQAALNRLLIGARSDGDLVLQLRQLAEAAPFVPLAIDGVMGNKTNAVMRSAGAIAGMTAFGLTTTKQVADATATLDAFSNAHGYPVRDTVKLAAGVVGAGVAAVDRVSQATGLSTPMLAIGAIGLGIAIAVLRRKSTPKQNPRTRRRRRRWR